MNVLLVIGVAASRNPVVFFRFRLSGLEVLLAYTANGANPILRDILESCAGCDSAVRISDFGIVFVAAKYAYIFLHSYVLLGIDIKIFYTFCPEFIAL